MGKLEKLRAKAKTVDVAEMQKANETALGSVLKGDHNKRMFLDLDVILLNPKNDYSRNDDETTVMDLAEDIKRIGLIHPVLVSYREDGTYVMLSGERRYKAYKYLRDHDTDTQKWNKIDASVAAGLDELDEMILLDSANLNVRGVSTNEQSDYIEMCARFIDNLKTKYELSDKDATDLAAKFTAVSKRTLQNNLLLKTSLNEGLLDEVYSGNISKDAAIQISRRPAAEQAHIYDTYKGVTEEDGADEERGVEYIKDVTDAIRTHKQVRKVKAKEPTSAVPVIDAKQRSFADCCARMEKALAAFDEKKRGNIGAFDKSVRNEFKKRMEKCLKEMQEIINELA